MADLWLIDAFTDRPFRGNPAAVCLLDGPVPDPWMQALAMEMNQAETAFLRIEGDGFRLRWFTPADEVDLCGHATLASAHFLWAAGQLGPTQVARFQTRSGLLTATRAGSGAITLDFPSTPPTPAERPAGLFEGLGITAGEVFSNRQPQPDYLVSVATPEIVTALTPDFGHLLGIQARGVIVTSAGGDPGIDFTSRFFGPLVGVNEDPVTGSAHCTLAPFWQVRLGKDTMTGYQASRRGGKVMVRVVGNRVELTGHAVTVVRGQVETPPAA